MLKFFNNEGCFITNDDIASFNIFTKDVATIKKFLEENHIDYQYYADSLAAFGQAEARFRIKRIIDCDHNSNDNILTEEQYQEIELSIIDEILNKSEEILDGEYLEDIARDMFRLVAEDEEEEDPYDDVKREEKAYFADKFREVS